MADLLKINQDAMKVVQLSELALGKASKWELDIITYEVRDKNGAIVREYKGREQQEAAQIDADNSNFAEEEDAPFYVTQRSNLKVDQKGQLQFKPGSNIGIVFPYEAIDAAADRLNNAVDCESIEQIIKDEVQLVKDMLESKTSKIADLTPFGDLLKLPTDPLKLLKWAKKFVSLYLGPQVLAMIDLAIQIAMTAQAITNIIQAAEAAQQNLLLCAESAIDTLLDESIGAATDLLETALPGIDSVLTEIAETQVQLAEITGAAPVFDTDHGIDGLIESATTENKAKFMTEVNSFVTAPYDTSSEEQDAITAAVGGSLSADAQFATGTLASAGAVTAEQSFTVDGTTFTFSNGILTAVA